MNRYKLYYLACPYSDPDEAVRDQRFKDVSLVTVKLLMDRGEYAFSPISYNHPMKDYDLPTDWAFWKPYDIAFLERCDGLIVLMLDGWDRSIGVAEEIKFALENNIPVRYMSMEEFN